MLNPSPLEPLTFHEEGGPSLTLSEACDNEFMSRVDGAFNAAFGKPIAKENLKKAKNWLRFHGLAVCETITASKPTLAQQIVQYLRNTASHGFRFWMPNGSSISLKGVLLLVAIAQLYNIRIVVFSTRRKPLEIISNTSQVCYTIALLWHQDSILSIGAWYPLGPAQNWTKQIPTVHMSTSTPMVSLPATQRLETAPKRNARVNYKSISDDTLKNLLHIVM